MKPCEQCGGDIGRSAPNAQFCWTCAGARLRQGRAKSLARKKAGIQPPPRKRPLDFRFQSLARGFVRVAIEIGLLPKPGSVACVDCGTKAYGYDHRDYARPLDVEPVCSGCNVRRGSAIPIKARIEGRKAA